MEVRTADLARPGTAPRSPWRDRRFTVFAAGNFVNNLGEGAYKVVLPLFAYSETRSLAVMSLLVALSPLTLLLSPALGALVDRHGSRIFVVPGLLLQLAGALALNLVVVWTARTPLVVLFACATLVQLGGELYRAGWMAGVPWMFPDNAAKSRAVLGSLFVTSNVAGPLLAAVTEPAIGLVGLLWFNAATFGAPIVVWLLGVHPPARKAPEAAGIASLVREISEGWQIVTNEKRVLFAKATALPLQMVSGIGITSFMLYYLRDHWHSSSSAASAAQGLANIGALAGSVLIAARTDVRPRSILLASTIGMTAALFVMPLPSPVFLLAAMTVFFFLRSAMTATSEMIIVKYLPPAAVGRGAGLFNLIDGSVILLGSLTIPLVQSIAGDVAVFVFLGILSSVSMVVLTWLWVRWGTSGPPVATGRTVSELPGSAGG